MFRSILCSFDPDKYLNNNESKIKKDLERLRKEAINYNIKQWKEGNLEVQYGILFEHGNLMLGKRGFARDFDDYSEEYLMNRYRNYMMNPNTWGSQVEMKAISHVLNISIHLYKEYDKFGPNNPQIINPEYNQEVRIVHRNKNHYDSLLPK